MGDSVLFSPYTLGRVALKSRVVMAPMTRSRSTPAHVPMELGAEYYGQRATAGLIITEGTSPSPNGAGYARIPGLWSAEQVAAWKPATEAVHRRGGHIFAQLMHTGRVSHPLNLDPGAEVLAPSAIATEGEMYTDAKGNQPYPVPRAMAAADLENTNGEFVTAAKNAITAGFDGVELHAANGYLLEQFLNPFSNTRSDEYGGSVEKRIRYVVEVAQAVASAIGGDRVGIRLSPYGVGGGMKPYPEIDATYTALVKALIPTGLIYLHGVDHSSMGAPPVSASLKASMRAEWPRTFILAGGFDKEKAEAALTENRANLIAFGRPFISNPDLIFRMRDAVALAPPDFKTFYTPGAKGYTDYPAAPGR